MKSDKQPDKMDVEVSKQVVMKDWSFRVTAATVPGETVCIVGSCPELGNWKSNGAVPMVQLDDLSEWNLRINIPDGIDIFYRYAVCIFPGTALNGTLGEAPSQLVVRRWETNLRPRKIYCHDQCDDGMINKFGYIPKKKSCQTTTSSAVEDPEAYNVQRGWLTNSSIIQLKVHGKGSLQVWKNRHQGKKFYIKVTPLETSKTCSDTSISNNSSVEGSGVDMEESVDIAEARIERKAWPSVEVAKTPQENALRWQKPYGVLYEEDVFILFQAQVFDLLTVTFLFDVFARTLQQQDDDTDELPPEHIGSAYVMPEHFRSTEGRIKKPIISRKFHPIGQITIDYLAVYPIKDITTGSTRDLCDFAFSYAKHWKPNWKGLDVGHRGLGNSYTPLHYCSNVRENTIASLKDAVAHGADMVEFDVQVSKDMVPVIYHNFELVTLIAKKNGEHHLVEMPLKNLTLDQLQHLKIHHHTEMSNGIKEFPEDDPDHHAFPTLERALRSVDLHAGFNVEIKWDMEKADGSRESRNAFEMNLFLDVVLTTVLTHGNSRKIVFSSFNPDVCTMLRYKQNRYPVLFLTVGVNTKYERYHDLRTHTIHEASNFVLMADVLGINAMAEDIMRDTSQVQLVKERGQVLFSWTDDMNDRDTVKYMKNLGVDGLVYDRVDVNKDKAAKESVFLLEREEEEIEQTARSLSRCASCSPSGFLGAGLNTDHPSPPLTPPSSKAEMLAHHVDEDASGNHLVIESNSTQNLAKKRSRVEENEHDDLAESAITFRGKVTKMVPT